MADDPKFDGTYYNNFKSIWNAFFGKFLPPLPDELALAFGAAVPAGWLGHKALVDAFKVAPGVRTRAWYRAAPRPSTSTPGGLQTQEGMRDVGYAGFVAAYGGLLLGTAIVAAYETWGSKAVTMVQPLAREVERMTGRSFSSALGELLWQAKFAGSPFGKAMYVGRAASNAKLYRRDESGGRW